MLMGYSQSKETQPRQTIYSIQGTIAPTGIATTAHEKDFVASKPYQGIRTTPMDPYEDGDCYVGDDVFPTRCTNNGEVTSLELTGAKRQ
eukprot:scaffold1353_cov161-Amphora_coffeaeformis.AAC.24